VCGTIIVNKAVTESIPSSETFPAGLILPDGVAVPGGTAFDLVVPGGATTSADVVFADVPVTTGETFTLFETLTGTLADRWDLVSIVCQNDNGTAATGATFDLAAGETVECTITNDPAPAEIHVTKVVDPGEGGSTEWAINVTGQPVQQISDGETLDYTDLDAGDFILTETDPPNTAGQPPFDAVGWSCSINGGAAVVQSGVSIGISLDPGDVANCTITNELIPAPQIAVTKTAAPTSFQEASGTVVYTVLVQNPGTEPLTVTSLTDDVQLNGGSFTTLNLASDTPGAAANGTVIANTCDTAVFGQTIPGSGQLACAFTVQFAGADAPDVIHDVVEAEGTDVFGRTITDDDDATVNVTDVLPVILVDKQNVQPVTLVAPGGAATYSVQITNGPGAIEPITITTVSDVMTVNGGAFGALNIATVGGAVTATTCGSLVGTVLAPGASVSCQFTVDTTVIGPLAEDDSLLNTVTVTAVDDEQNPVIGDDDAERPVLGEPPAMTVFKTDNGAVIDEPGEVVRYDIDITNAGTTEDLTIVSIVDEVFFNGAPLGTITITSGGVASTLPAGMVVNTASCEALIGDVVAPGGLLECFIDLDLPANASDDYNDTVIVNAVDETGDAVEAENSAETPAAGVPPLIDITKTPNPSSLPETGGDVTYTFVITNNSVSTDPLTIVSLIDAPFGDLLADPNAAASADPCPALAGVVIQPGDSETCQIVRPLQQNAGTTHPNLVTVVAHDDEGVEVNDSAPAAVTFTDVAPTVDVTKTADPTTLPETGGNVTFTVDVHNTSFEPVTLTSLNDSVFGPLGGQGTCVLGVVIAPDATYTCAFTKPLAQVGTETSHTNVVTGVVTDDDQSTATDFDDAVVTYTLIPPTVEITKTDGDATVTAPGGPVTYTLQITNTSDEHVTVTTLTDTITYTSPANVIVVNLLAPVAPVSNSTCAAQVAAGLEPDQTVTCTFVVALSGDLQIVSDVVNVIVADNDGQTDDDSDDEQTPINALVDLAIVKTASVATADRGTTFNWVLDVVNNGPSTATTVAVSDTVPAPLVVTGVSSAQFSCSNAGNVVTCTSPSMAAGATGQINVTVSVPVDAAAGPILNVGSVSSITPDSNLTNNSDDASVTVPPVAVQPPPPVVLPRTGSGTAMTMVRLATLLLGVGAAVLLASRRRRLNSTP